MSQAFNIIIYRGISALCHGREVLDGLNATDKGFILRLMSTVQIPVIQHVDTQITMHSSMHNSGVSLEQ